MSPALRFGLVLLLAAPAVTAQTVSQDYARYASMLTQERADQAHREQQSLYDQSASGARSASSSSSSSSRGSASSGGSTSGSAEVVGLLGNTLNNIVDRHNANEARRQAENDAARARADAQWKATQKASDDFIEAWEKAHPLIQRNLEKAAKGDVTAMGEAGIQYARGIGVKQNKERGLDLLSNAALHGNATAAEVLSVYYANGEPGFVDKDPAKSHEWTIVAAKLGNLSSIVAGCVDFLDGTGTPRNYPEGERLCNEAVARGDANGALNLGYLYSTDSPGLAKDRAKAAMYLEKAIALGSKDALDHLSNVYRGGDGLPADYAARFKLIKPFADKGDVVSEVEVGISYYLGQGVAKSDTLAVQWLTKAADAGSARGMHELSLLVLEGEGTRTDTVRANKLTRQSAVQGWGPALYSMGIRNMNGDDGVQQDQIEGERLLVLAANAGDIKAPCTLGQIYANGYGVDVDIPAARRWYKLGTERGDKSCAANMKKLPPAL